MRGPKSSESFEAVPPPPPPPPPERRRGAENTDEIGQSDFHSSEKSNLSWLCSVLSLIVSSVRRSFLYAIDYWNHPGNRRRHLPNSRQFEDSWQFP
ncbi:hypothetical protein F0562_027308 [Nyssa sinensis]|uniref:Uncharacterized protein n=1 Tax=Nyssa sinensis TaxID=561372 RepID=A0A5J5B764_9ASTE|nr:hypothetical protein F0562_027308 [Nyssa sinensis]